MSEFKREARYYVIKRSDLKAAPVYLQVEFEIAIEKLSPHLPVRECLTIESDWPEYGPAWAAIEARITGYPLKAGQGEAVAHRLLNASGEVITDWYDGPAPHRITDICGREPGGVRIESAYTAPPATGVIVPRELLERAALHLSEGRLDGPAACELRALVAQSQGVKP